METLNKKIAEEMDGVDEFSFLLYQARNGQASKEMVGLVKDIISENGLSASEAKGFMEYMKMIIDLDSYIPKKK